MKLRAAGLVTALLVALASTDYPAEEMPGGLAVAPPRAPAGDRVAAEDSPGGVGPVQQGSQPAPSTPEALRPMQQTPTHPTSPDRTAYEERASQDLKSWEKRLDGFTSRARGEAPDRRADAARLNRELTAVKQQWEGLRQASGEDWSVQRKQFEHAFGRFKRHWQKAQAKAKAAG